MPSPAPPRVLIVDDEAAQMRALCDTLKDHGYETVGFIAGRLALQALRESRFDLLLADLTMPEMDGITLLQTAQEIDPDLVGIIMTGDGTIATAVEAMRTGALDYVLKPFRLSMILPVLSRALAVRHLRLANAELQRSVRDRSIELEAANKELEAFSYSVSHDLRSPLTVILGAADTLIEDHAAVMPAPAKQFLDAILKSAERMTQLIDDLLRLSRFGREPMAKHSFDMTALVREVLDELVQAQGGRRIEVQLDALPDAVGDPALIRQVFANLLSNAFKFTRGQPTPTITVSCRVEAGEKVYSVRDNGAGFDMRQAQNLFGAFHRLHSAQQFEGTGVGLSIAHRIVQRHGGRIWAEAEPRKGAAFHFSLPD